VGQAQTQLSEQLATQITTNLYKTLVSAVEDPVGAKLTSQLVQSFSDALRTEMKEKKLLSEIQSLLFDFLEEIKLNYVQRLSQEDIDQIIEQTRHLRTQVSVPAVVDKSTALPEIREG
jgi:cob(I)alamin adenosyltransferase